MSNIELICGDNIEVLKGYPDNSVDAVVTDPPYGLGEEPDATEMLKAWIDHGYLEVKGKGFMGKSWDAFVPQPVFWKEVFRVLKPGGHVLAFYGTRTYDWGVMAMRLAGFEVRNQLSWVYGCLSDDTEVLTEHGWMGYSHIRKTKSIRIFTYNKETDVYRIELPEKWSEYKIKDTCYRIESDFTDQIVSRNHRCLIEREGKLVFRTAETLEQQENIPFLESLSELPKAISHIYERTSEEKQDLWERMFQGELVKSKKRETYKTTSFTKRKRNNLSCLRKEKMETRRLAEKIGHSSLFKRVQWDFERRRMEKARSQRKEVLVGGTRRGIKNTNDWGKKPILERWNNLSPKERILFKCETEIHSLPTGIYFDGQKGRICSGIQTYYGNANRQTTVEDGVRSSQRPQSNKQRHNELDVVFNEQRSQGLRTRKTYSTTVATITPFEYEGIVFCPTVSTGAFVARRNGKIFITGNSGFPKSHNVSKAIDKQGGESLNWFIDYILEVAKERGISKKELTMLFPSKNGNPTGWLWNKQNNQSITLRQYNVIKDYLNLPFDTMEEAKREVVGKGKAGLTKGTIANFAGETEFDITTPSTEAAKKWDGWGSDLKPAMEPIVLARKPLEKGLSIAENVLKWGTGGINIDGCRIKTNDDLAKNYASVRKGDHTMGERVGAFGFRKEKDSFAEATGSTELGRFPANFILQHHPDCKCVNEEETECVDGCPVKILDEQSGLLKSGKPAGNKNLGSGYHGNFGLIPVTGYGDEGYASRFFYVAKASQVERNWGLDEFDDKEMSRSVGSQNNEYPKEQIGLNKTSIVKNIHPTIKPVKLMQYLVRMITPIGGVCLDPFNGSGTTGIACKLERIDYIGIDMEQEYIDISRGRIDSWVDELEVMVERKIKEEKKDKTQLGFEFE